MSDAQLSVLLGGLLSELGLAIGATRTLMPKDAPLTERGLAPFTSTEYTALEPLIDLWRDWDGRFNMLVTDEAKEQR